MTDTEPYAAKPVVPGVGDGGCGTRAAGGRAGYTVKLTVRRADTGEVVLSTMLGDALAAIDERGAIYSAARAIGASYSHVWGDLRRAEGVHGGPLVESSGARGSELTCRGRDVLERFRRLSGAIERELASWPPLAPPPECPE